MRRLLPLLLTCILLASCAAPAPGGSSGGAQSSPGHMSLSWLALKEPVYPDFPTYPDAPLGNNWDTYFEQQNDYYNCLSELRGDGIPSETVGMLTNFAGQSTALLLGETGGENAVYSPLSLWSALAMLAQCADGTSRQQVLDALGTGDVEALQDLVPQIWKGLYTDDGASSLLLANSIWLNNELKGSYVQETLDTLADTYYAGSYSVPMGHPVADQAITDWISEQTRGLIGSGDPVVETKAETLAMLVSSLYYRAAWTDEFNAGLTEEDTFTAADGTEADVDFMHKTLKASFLRREGYQAAQLGTMLGQMVFVLPDEGISPESLLADPELIAALDFSGSDVRWGEVQWSVPKFDVDSSLDLLDALTLLGITDLQDPHKADLSALTTLGAYLSSAEQLARVKVDEEGVEAAAVTIFTADCTSAFEEKPEVCIMDLDRPFLFLLRTEGIPLFVGIVNQI